MLPQLRRHVSLEFTALIFVLLVLQGLLFIAIDHERDIRRIDGNITGNVRYLVEGITESEKLLSVTETPLARARSRIFDAEGNVLFSGMIFSGNKPELDTDPWLLEYEGDSYRVLTVPVYTGKTLHGYVQMAEKMATLGDRLLDLAPVLIIENITLSFLVFVIGIWFQKRSMRPAYEMFTRLEQFAQDAGHELKTPLATARSSLEIALVDEKFREHIVEAVSDIDRMGKLTTALLQLTTLTEKSLRKNAVNLSDLANNVVRELRRDCVERGIHLTESIAPSVIRIADPVLIRVVMRNLVHNAIKFSQENGTVCVVLTDDYFSVRDTGVGMSPDVLERIFNRFFKADPSRSDTGFGLGLTILKRIVDLHRWQITVKSAPGAGSTFTLWFDHKRIRIL